MDVQDEETVTDAANNDVISNFPGIPHWLSFNYMFLQIPTLPRKNLGNLFFIFLIFHNFGSFHGHYLSVFSLT